MPLWFYSLNGFLKGKLLVILCTKLVKARTYYYGILVDDSYFLVIYRENEVFKSIIMDNS